MLPPKRSTRSTHTVTQVTEADPDLVPEHNDVQHIKLPALAPLVEDKSKSELQFVLSSARHETHPETQADSGQKKPRRKLTTSQRLALEELASRGNSPSLETRRMLAEEIGLELKVVSVWFQNKRRPANRLDEIAQSNDLTVPATDKAEQGYGQVLADVNVNTKSEKTTALASFTKFLLTPVSKAVQDGTEVSAIWSFLPSSSPGKVTESRHTETKLFHRAAADSATQQNKRRSLEWACMNERATKRGRALAGSGVPNASINVNASFGTGLQHRQRTDRKPRKPSHSINASASRAANQAHDRPVRNGTLSCSSCTEKDVLDVALALIQLKQQGQSRIGRKSI